MNIAVLIKQVPDTGMNLRINQSETSIEESGLKWVLSPYDEFAIEEALKLKTKLNSKVFAVSLGPLRHAEACRNALALGADEAFHLVSEKSFFDPLIVSKILSENIKVLDSVSLVFCGKLATDTNDFACPQMVAHFLNFPCVTNVNELQYEADTFTLKRECGGGKEEVLKAKLPLVLSADKGLNTPRYPSLPGIMQAKKKPLHKIQVNLKEEEKIKQVKLQYPPEKAAPQMLKGNADEQVKELVRILREKEKLI